jgi:hypothetical protein
VNAPHGPWEDDDSDEGSVLDAFDMYVHAEVADANDARGAREPSVDNADDQILTLLFTATNPPETVSVAVLLDGRVLRVELAPQVTSMTESELADEISVIAGLARQQARAAQHALVVESMLTLGHDRVATRGFLEHELGLPSPDTVTSERAQLFAARYTSEYE